MKLKYLVNTLTALALIVSSHAADNGIEESTVSPIAEKMIEDSVMSTSTENPASATTNEKSEKTKAEQTQPQTVGDFIIHPLIAFKPRTPEHNSPAGKQAAENTTSIFPWTFFSYPTRQGLGGSVSTFAGQVGNWINDRITFPGLLDTPVRESTTTSTTTTTTPLPDVVVRVQHKTSTRKPIIKINNQQNKNKRQRPNHVEFTEEEDDDADDFQQNNFDDEEEQDEEEVDEQADDQQHEVLNNRKQHAEEEEEVAENDDESDDEADAEENYDEDDDQAEEDDDVAEEEELVQRPNTLRRPVQKRRFAAAQRQPVSTPNKRRYQPIVEQYEDENDNEFYYGVRPSTKRSQNQLGLIQRGQQSLINQIHQLTGGQTPAEIAAAQRRAQSKKRRQQGTLFINRNGQNVYLAPELTNAGVRPQQVVINKRVKPGQFPQPPLTVPLRRKGHPTQYITIPWSQLGISPPNQIIGIAEGLQSQPLIFNIPQSAINQMQSGGNRKNQRPLITADSVPLLAEASLMDIFKPPRIPPSRYPKPTKKPSTVETTPATAEPVVVAMLPQHIHAGTTVETAPEMADTVNTSSIESVETQTADQSPNALRNAETQYIIIGADEEPGLTRHAQPVLGEARYVPAADFGPYLEALSRRRLAFHKAGRALEKAETTGSEQRIPVQVIVDEEQKPVAETKAVPQAVAAATRTLPNMEDAAMPVAAVSDMEQVVMPAAIPNMEKVRVSEDASVLTTVVMPENVPILENVSMPKAVPVTKKVVMPESMMMTE